MRSLKPTTLKDGNSSLRWLLLHQIYLKMLHFGENGEKLIFYNGHGENQFFHDSSILGHIIF